MDFEGVFSELWLAAFWGPLAVGIILFILGKVFSGKNKEKIVTFRYVQEVVIKHVLEVKESKKASRPAPQSRSNGNKGDDPTPALILVGLLFLSFFYAKYQIEFVAVISGFSTLILSFVLFTVFFGINKNIAHDQEWIRYLFTTSFLALLGYPLMFIAINPIHSPLEVSNMSNAIMGDSIAGMLKAFGFKGIGFIIYQALGFMTLALAMLLQVLSLTFYTSVIQLAVSESPRPVVDFVAKVTSRFKNPNRTTIFSIVLYIISFILISGIGYEWVLQS